MISNTHFLNYANANINANLNAIEKRVTKDFEFILSHLTKPYWPRTISTKLTKGGQFTVYSRLEALSYFKDSNYLDCRISAYSPESKTIDFIMIDLDMEKFKTKQFLDHAKSKTLTKILKIFQIHNNNKFKPTVMWSGNGYHIYLPTDSQGICFNGFIKGLTKAMSLYLGKNF